MVLSHCQTLFPCFLGNSNGDCERHLANVRERGVNRSILQVVFCDHLRQHMGGRQKHFIADTTGFTGDSTQTDAGENTGIIPLPRAIGSAGIRNRLKRTAAGKDSATFGQFIGLFGNTFGSGCWIGQGENNRSLVDLCHQAQHFFRESSGCTGRTDQHMRLYRPYRLNKTGRGRSCAYGRLCVARSSRCFKQFQISRCTGTCSLVLSIGGYSK